MINYLSLFRLRKVKRVMTCNCVSIILNLIYFKLLTSRSGSPKAIFSVPMALIIATNDCIVLLYTTGLYCLLSSFVNPPSWIILMIKKKRDYFFKQKYLNTDFESNLITIVINLVKKYIKGNFPQRRNRSTMCKSL